MGLRKALSTRPLMTWAALGSCAVLTLSLAAWLAWPSREEPGWEGVVVLSSLPSDAASTGLEATAAGPAGDAATPVAFTPRRHAGADRASADPNCPAEWQALAGKSSRALDEEYQRWRPAALTRAADLLLASHDPFDRVAGRLLHARVHNPDGSPDAEALLAVVSEALSGPDPRVAALAWQLCSVAAPEQAPACTSMTPQRWAALDPDNVQAWLAVATDAQNRGDAATAREAMGRAGASGHSRLIGSDVRQLAASPSLALLSQVDRELLAVELMGVGGAMVADGTLSASGLCPMAPAWPRRRADCNAVATLMVEHGETLLERGIGLAIGRRVGWEEERVAALQQDHHEMVTALLAATDMTMRDDGEWTVTQACQAHQRVALVLDDVLRHNEVDIARRGLQKLRAAPAAGQ